VAVRGPATPTSHAEQIGKFVWYNPGTDPNESQEYAKTRKTRVRSMTSHIHWLTPQSAPAENPAPDFSVPFPYEGRLTLNKSAWGLDARGPATLPDDVNPGDLNIPGNFYGTTPHPGRHGIHHTEQQLVELQSLTQTIPDGWPSITAALTTIDKHIAQRVDVCRSSSPSRKLPTPTAFGIDESTLRDQLKPHYPTVTQISGADLLSFYRMQAQLSRMEPACLSLSNTASNTHYLQACREAEVDWHPARFPKPFVEYFIARLSTPGALVLDPFAGSNLVGKVAEEMGRRWIGIEREPKYVESSEFRFQSLDAIKADHDPQQPKLDSF